MDSTDSGAAAHARDSRPERAFDEGAHFSSVMGVMKGIIDTRSPCTFWRPLAEVLVFTVVLTSPTLACAGDVQVHADQGQAYAACQAKLQETRSRFIDHPGNPQFHCSSGQGVYSCVRAEEGVNGLCSTPYMHAYPVAATCSARPPVLLDAVGADRCLDGCEYDNGLQGVRQPTGNVCWSKPADPTKNNECCSVD